jgi:tRNA pseudouridine32 synthase/23S rRNA pseudouridine746 synthase
MEKDTSIAAETSKVWLPEEEWDTVLDFLCGRFGAVSREQWESRMARGKVFFEDGELITTDTAYRPSCRVAYFRELAAEKPIPFQEEILFEDENILIADKPHFLPVHPAGNYINETLLNRLKESTGNIELNHAHRIDRLTAGLVLLTKRKEIRSHYQTMFENNLVSKTYEAVGVPVSDGRCEWHVTNRLTAGDPWFLMKEGEGEPNSESYIRRLHGNGECDLFELMPVSGKKHQLRVHLCCIGSGIINDPFYPALQDETDDDYEKPLQLLAKKLEFTDPLTDQRMCFESRLKLNFSFTF